MYAAGKRAGINSISAFEQLMDQLAAVSAEHDALLQS